jgi:bifunctional non-homologous end joining protein LigD
MSLTKYKQKRKFSETPEPEGQKTAGKGTLKFVIQRHAATRLHYDFRLEMEGVLKSWAVPKGPSLNPKDKRLAMMVEDHPFSYRTFEGVIPEGNYGAGVVEIWDEGTYEHIEDSNRKTGEKKLLSDLHKGSLKFVLHGKKLKGEFALVKIKNSEENAWLLIKHNDEYAVRKEFDAEKLTDPKSKVTAAIAAKAAKKSARRQTTVKKKSEPVSASTVKKKPVSNLQPGKKLHKFITPMFAKPGGGPFNSDDWIFELKWDGYRAVAEVGGGDVKFYSRNGLSFANKYETVYEELQGIKEKMILDGEVVVFNEAGKPDFQKLQLYSENTHLPIIYYVFDIISYKGKDLTGLPLLERKKLLQKVLPQGQVIRYCDHVEDEGKAFFEQIVKKNMEGMIAKRKDSTYHIGKRTNEWLKIKHHNTEEVVIAGFTAPRGGRKHFGALVLGRYEGKELKYAGHTGTGFDDASLKDMSAKLKLLVRDTSPFREKIKTNMPVTWVEPVLVCNIKFTELTNEKIFRHPVFQGLRVDKKATEVKADPMPAVKASSKKVPKKGNSTVAETSSSSKRRAGDDEAEDTGTRIIKLNGNEIKLTNQNKIYWPEEGYTKGDMINYYNTMYKYVLPYLKDRPESLNRTPNGITNKGFYQKDAGGHAPGWVKSVKLYSESTDKDIDYIICNDRLTLSYLNNLGCIELNPWNSRLGSLEFPDYMVIDLDPSDKNTFEEVIDAALATKEVLDKAGATAFCKTSGSTGLHIYVPMGAKYTYDQVRDFCKIIVMQVQEMMPDNTTLERSLKKRSDKKMYLDFLQNRQGQTLACAYSLRPKRGATASAPLDWKEVKKGLHPSQFDIQTLPRRVEKIGDIFKGVLGKGVDILKCLKKLGV